MSTIINATTTNGVVIQPDNSGSLQLQTNSGTTAVTISTAQNVGIGTTSPSSILNVSAASPTILLTATTTTGTTIGNKNNRLLLASNSGTVNNGGEIVFAATDTNVDRWAAISGAIQSNSVSGCYGDILFATKSTDAATTLTERMRIDSSGNVLVGTTIPDPTTDAFSFQPTNKYGCFSHITGTSSGTGYVFFRLAAASIGSITQNGTTAVLYNTTSDYRLKNDIKPIQNALTIIETLNPVSFTWIDNRKDNGFIAHELQKVLPNCVTGEKDDVNEDGTPKYQQMDNSGVIPFLVKAIQEQQAIINDLKARIETLEAK
jgi:hypothetical protein